MRLSTGLQALSISLLSNVRLDISMNQDHTTIFLVSSVTRKCSVKCIRNSRILPFLEFLSNNVLWIWSSFLLLNETEPHESDHAKTLFHWYQNIKV